MANMPRPLLQRSSAELQRAIFPPIRGIRPRPDTSRVPRDVVSLAPRASGQQAACALIMASDLAVLAAVVVPEVVPEFKPCSLTA